MIKVKLMNPEVVESLYEQHGKFAAVCYDSSEENAVHIGKACQEKGHMSGSRCSYIIFRISGVDRGTAEQMMRHEIGTAVPLEMQDNYSIEDLLNAITRVSPDHIVKNCASFRYIDKAGFNWATPGSIASCPEAKREYDALMDIINEKRQNIKNALVDAGYPERAAIQDANFVLPRATTTDLMIGFTPEALIHFCHKRMCSRSQEFIRKIAYGMREEVFEYSPRLAWEMKPQCEYLMWCPEGQSCCGRSPTKLDLQQMIYDAQKR